eukprot:3937576-Alexandrium_andersonii.AAC.1
MASKAAAALTSSACWDLACAPCPRASLMNCWIAAECDAAASRCSPDSPAGPGRPPRAAGARRRPPRPGTQ